MPARQIRVEYLAHRRHGTVHYGLRQRQVRGGECINSLSFITAFWFQRKRVLRARRLLHGHREFRPRTRRLQLQQPFFRSADHKCTQM